MADTRQGGGAVFKKLLNIIVPHKPVVFLIGVGVSVVLTPLFALMGNGAAQRQAFSAIGAFAPWGLFGHWLRTIVTTCDSADPILGISAFCDHMPLSRHFPIGLRPLTGVVDVLAQTFASGGAVGFIVAFVQVALGAVVTWIIFTPDTPTEKRGFVFYSLGLPIGAVALGSALAIPIWVLAWIAMTVVKGGSDIALALQTLSTSTICATVCVRAAEGVTHHAAVAGVAAALKIDPD
jgi:hypothetical protein